MDINQAAEVARLEADGEKQLVEMYERNQEEAKVREYRSIVIPKSDLFQFTIAAREKEIEELRSSIANLQSRLEWAEAKAEVDDMRDQRSTSI